jgi:hypothetical protein
MEDLDTLLPVCKPHPWWRTRHLWDKPWGSMTCQRCHRKAYIEYGR